MSQLAQYALSFLFLLPAIILHEISHGWVAYRLGDPTAKNAGRLSLNPIRHIDLFGTIILPALLILVSGFGFGYAKPVPINPNYFKDYRRGMFLTGIAGPTTNLILAALSGLAFRLVPDMGYLSYALILFCQMNLVLVFFNLIPIPPLDGSRVIPLFLSDRAMRTYHQVEQYGFVILLAALWLVPMATGWDPLQGYFDVTVGNLTKLFAGV